MDFETFNLCLHFVHNRPWQLGMLRVKGEEIVESYSSFIKWNDDLKISRGAAAITGYDKAKVDKDGKAEEQVFEVIYKWLKECDYIVGHNILNFDYYLFNWWCKMRGLDGRFFVHKALDTHLLARGLKDNLPFDRTKYPSLLEYQYKLDHLHTKTKTNLTTLGKEYGIEFEYDKLHDADNDIKLNLLVWNKLKWQVEV